MVAIVVVVLGCIGYSYSVIVKLPCSPRNLYVKPQNQGSQSITKCCGCHNICRSKCTKCCDCHKMCPSRFTKCLACHGICASRFASRSPANDCVSQMPKQSSRQIHQSKPRNITKALRLPTNWRIEVKPLRSPAPLLTKVKSTPDRPNTRFPLR